MTNARTLSRLLAVVLLFPTTVAIARQVPDFGLITNADGDNAFRAETLEESQRLLRAEAARELTSPDAQLSARLT